MFKTKPETYKNKTISIYTGRIKSRDLFEKEGFRAGNLDLSDFLNFGPSLLAPYGGFYDILFLMVKLFPLPIASENYKKT